MAAQVYLSYTSYLYDWSMGLWYEGSSVKNPKLVNASVDLWHRSLKAARHEGVQHPEDYDLWGDADDISSEYDEIPF